MLEKINLVLNYVKINSNYYRKSLANFDSLTSIKDIKKLPFTTKENISNNNDDFLCVSEKKVKDFVTTSGTTGDPISFYLTSNDLKRLAINEKNSLEKNFIDISRIKKSINLCLVGLITCLLLFFILVIPELTMFLPQMMSG